MKNTSSISFYIASRLLILFAAFVACYTFIVNHVYLWGMDEATAFYMSNEAEMVLASYLEGDDIQEFLPGFREYYWPGQLPEHYQMIFPQYSHALNQLLMLPGDVSTTYLLPLGEQSVELYVVHILPNATAEDQSSVSIRQLLILAGVTALVALVLLTGWFVFKLVSAITMLSRWASRLNSEMPESMVLPQSRLHFRELNLLGEKLAGSFTELARVNDREQQFLRSLSHELRTPIAVTSAALDVLDKKVDDSSTAKLTARIRRASNTMRSLTETILWLWREPDSNADIESVLLQPLLEQAIVDHQYMLKSKSVEVDNKVTADLALKMDKTLLVIVCNNLIRNAFQHCDEGKVCIMADERGLAIGNSYGESVDDNGQSFGLGLLIVQRIADNYGWRIEIEKTNGQFKLAIRF